MSANNSKTAKRLEFQLKASNASKKAQSALDYAILSGKPSKVSDYEVLSQLAKMLSNEKFSKEKGFNVVFFRNDLKPNGEIERTEFGLDVVQTALENGIELRPAEAK